MFCTLPVTLKVRERLLIVSRGGEEHEVQYTPSDPDVTGDTAMSTEEYDRRNPGYGGFVPIYMLSPPAPPHLLQCIHSKCTSRGGGGDAPIAVFDNV